MDRERIMNIIKKHYESVVGRGYEVVGVFLTGSQNYGMDIDESDVDTKAIVIPSFDHYANNMSEITLNIADVCSDLLSGNCLVKDISSVGNLWLKGSMNFIEILFTEYKIVNPKYESFMNELINEREMIAHCKPHSTLLCALKMMKNKFKYIQHDVDILCNDLDNDIQLKSISKSYTHIARLNDFIRRFYNGELYESCLRVPESISSLRNLIIFKSSIASLMMEADKLIYQSEEIIISDINFGNTKYNETVELINKVCKEVIKKSLLSEFGFIECNVPLMTTNIVNANGRCYSDEIYQKFMRGLK